jgi:hypothetical protein
LRINLSARVRPNARASFARAFRFLRASHKLSRRQVLAILLSDPTLAQLPARPPGNAAATAQARERAAWQALERHTIHPDALPELARVATFALAVMRILST